MQFSNNNPQLQMLFHTEIGGQCRTRYLTQTAIFNVIFFLSVDILHYSCLIHHATLTACGATRCNHCFISWLRCYLRSLHHTVRTSHNTTIIFKYQKNPGMFATKPLERMWYSHTSAFTYTTLIILLIEAAEI